MPYCGGPLNTFPQQLLEKLRDEAGDFVSVEQVELFLIVKVEVDNAVGVAVDGSVAPTGYHVGVPRSRLSGLHVIGPAALAAGSEYGGSEYMKII